MNDLERYLEEFGSILARAEPARSRRPRRTALAAAASVGAAVLAVLILATPSGHRLDVVAQARAALSAPSELIHVVITRTSSPTVEAWSTSGPPPRWRIAFSIPSSGSLKDARGPLAGPAQVAYAAGGVSTYYQQRNSLEILRGVPPPARTDPLGNDPIATLRGLLDRGELRDAGELTVDGRRVRRLIGERHQSVGGVHIALQFDVDPASFAPVSASISTTPPILGPAAPGQPHPSTFVSHFDRFETLPLTPENAALLEIQPVGTPTTTERTVPPGECCAPPQLAGAAPLP